MRIFKSIIKFMVFIVAAVFFVTACSLSSSPKLSPNDTVSLEIWHYYNGPQKIAFDEMVTDFNETVGLKMGIILEAFNQGSVSDLLQKVVDSANKKVGTDDIPDIFAAYADTAYEVDNLGLVADLRPYFTDEELNSYVDSYIAEGRFDQEGSLKIFPIAKSTEVMMLNKTAWDEFATATGTTVDTLSTLEGVSLTAQKYYEWTDSLTPAPDDGKTFFGRDAVANYFISGMKQMGITFFDVGANGKVTFNLNEAALRKLWDNYYVPTINGYFGSFGKFRSDDAKTGDLIALVCSTSGSLYFPTEVTLTDGSSYPIESIVMKTPCFEGAERYSIQQGAGMVVTKSDERQEYAAAEFLKWFTDAQRNIDFSLGSGYLPVKKEANDAALIESAFSDLDSEALKLTMLVACDEVQNDQLYTNKAFEGGADARKILDYSLSDKAKVDFDAIRQLIANGSSRKDAVARYDTEENFKAWVADFTAALEATQA